MSTDILKALDDSNLTTHQKVEAIFARSEALLQVALPVRNVIMQLGSHRTDLEDALAGTCYRLTSGERSQIELRPQCPVSRSARQSAEILSRPRHLPGFVG
jgi:hypothetical protein